MQKLTLLVLATGVWLSACSSKKEETTTEKSTADTVAVAPAPAPEPAPTEPAPAPKPDSAAAPAGFDAAAAPIGQNPTGGWPYFSIIEGYRVLTQKTDPGEPNTNYVKDVAYDQYEFYDGAKLIPVEGRLYTAKAVGKSASFFQAKKTYEKFITDLGGVRVYEGKNGEEMKAKKLKYNDGRHRGYYLDYDESGVYMVRTPDRQIWVEVYKPWDTKPENYWLTIVETKPLPMQAKLLPAEEMKKALDKDGHVALYINFDTDKTAMKAESQPIVGEIAKLLTADPALKLTVEGHTDDAGTPAHNQELSVGRANAVVGALMAQGIALDRLQPKGFGQTKPLVPNDSDANKAKNRRVELVKR